MSNINQELIRLLDYLLYPWIFWVGYYLGKGDK